MIDEKPDSTGMPRPSQKLILPGPDAVYPPPDQHIQRDLPEHFAHSKQMSLPSMLPLPTQKRSWRKDPAYVVLLVAICAVLIAGIVFAAVASNIFFSGTTQTATTALKGDTAPQSTIDAHPTFPIPGGNQGGTVSSQPPKTGTATVQPNPTSVPIATAPPAQPTPTPTQSQNGQLTVQINNPPTQVPNNTIVPIDVTTSEANATVRLVVTYNVSPYSASAGPQVTDANGNATLSWVVAVRMFGRTNSVTAHIMVVASDQNNNEVVSQTFTVKILVRGIIVGG
ncbi:MAG: hypothetical protein NVS4B11_23260 [Ktedonobacteraceae bacterium]